MVAVADSAAWDVVCLPIVIKAATEDEARAKFLRNITDYSPKIVVLPHADENIYARGNDAIGT